MNWPKFDVMPEGWRLDKTSGSPVSGYEFATDGRSIINGGKRALVAIRPQSVAQKIYPEIVAPELREQKPIDKATRKAMNDLARAKFKEHLLKDLSVDLIICKMEGWDKSQYVEELHALIDEVYERIKPSQSALF